MAGNTPNKRINGDVNDFSPKGETSAGSVTQRELIEMRQYVSRIRRKCSAPPALRGQSGVSSFKGHSMEFLEGQTYQTDPGKPCTDPRIRTGRVLTNVIGEDQERSVFVLIDGRVPMKIATQESSKFVLAARMASLLGWLACDQGNRVGGEIFTRHGHQHVRPSRGTISVIRLINMLIAAQQNVAQYDTEIDRAAGARALDDALLRLNETAKSGSLVFILSDFRVTNVVAERQLMRLSRRNKVVAVFLYDALERVLRTRCRYRNRSLFQARRNRLMNLMNRYAISLITCSTADDPFACLRAYLYRDRGFEDNRRQ